jgi:hypothetical protein
MEYQDIYLDAFASMGAGSRRAYKSFDRYGKGQHQGLYDRAPDEAYRGTLPGARDTV